MSKVGRPTAVALQCLVPWWQRSTAFLSFHGPQSTLDVMNFPEEETTVLSFAFLSAEVFIPHVATFHSPLLTRKPLGIGIRDHPLYEC